jgi:hypothetical protein
MMDKTMKKVRVQWKLLLVALLVGITLGAVFYPTKHIRENERLEVSAEYENKIKDISDRYLNMVQEVKEQLSTKERALQIYQEETSKRLASLVQENRELRRSTLRKKLKLIKPDGTILEKEYEESQSEEITRVVVEVREEFDKKIRSIEDRWKEVHRQRVEKMQKEFTEKLRHTAEEYRKLDETYTRERLEEINRKRFRPEIGVTSTGDTYLHATYNMWGPVLIGAGINGSGLLNWDLKFNHIGAGVGIEF